MPMLGWDYPPIAPGGGRGVAGEPGDARRRVRRTLAHADGRAAAGASREPVAQPGGVARGRETASQSVGVARGRETASPSGRGRAERG
jgi:hypothetical protein